MTFSPFSLRVEYRDLVSLKPCTHNSRKHSKRQILQIADSIKAFGFTNPVLINSDSMIVAGHGRVEAAKLLGICEVPTIRLEALTIDQIRAYIIADNKLVENAGWDESILAIELQYLFSIDFDVGITGFEVPEIDLILNSCTAPTADEDLSVGRHKQPITQPGDLWQMGKHRLGCGSALDEECISNLMDGRRANIVFTDPPYNVPIDGNAANIGGKTAHRYREFVMAAGEMSDDEFSGFLTATLRLLHQFGTGNSVHFICMDWRHISALLAAGSEIYDELLNVCVWVKGTGGMGSFYRSRHEFVAVFRNGKDRHRNNIQLGRFGRNRTNVWEYPSVNTFSKGCEEGNLLALHPTVKPTALVADALLDCSTQGDIVLDSFLGSGSTLIAAEKIGRICYGVEIDPLYVDTAVRRWQEYTGGRAVHTLTGKQFDELEIARAASNG